MKVSASMASASVLPRSSSQSTSPEKTVPVLSPLESTLSSLVANRVLNGYALISSAGGSVVSDQVLGDALREAVEGGNHVQLLAPFTSSAHDVNPELHLGGENAASCHGGPWAFGSAKNRLLTICTTLRGLCK
jgi:hypothetical protein